MPQKFFDEKENLADLLKQMPDEERERYLRFGHNRIEAAFDDRMFIVYEPDGLTKSGAHKPPIVRDVLKVSEFEVTKQNGSRLLLTNQDGQGMQITHVPRRVFNYPVYMSIPAHLTLRWDARVVNDRVWRSLSYAVLIKAKNRADFYSKGNTYLETPNVFRKLYPQVTGEFNF